MDNKAGTGRDTMTNSRDQKQASDSDRKTTEHLTVARNREKRGDKWVLVQSQITHLD
jgi:hypothetical protein